MTGKSISRKPGASIYPIRPGMIFKLHATKMKKNNVLNCYLEHEVYIWILGVGKKDSKTQWKNREVRLVRFEVPVAKDKRHFFIEPARTKMRYENAARLLNKGFEEIGEVEFRYNQSSWTKFYRAIGYL